MFFSHGFGNEIIVGVTSDKEIKTNPVLHAFQKAFPNDTISIAKFKTVSGIPEQPIGRKVGVKGAKNRLNFAKNLAKKLHTLSTISYWVSIENFIEDPHHQSATDLSDKDTITTHWNDRAAIVIENSAKRITSIIFSAAAPLPIKYVKMAKENGQLESGGYSVTSGDMFIIKSSITTSKSISPPGFFVLLAVEPNRMTPRIKLPSSLYISFANL